MTATPLRLGVLDQSPISRGGDGALALRNTLDLARAADRFGFHRYWLAEHHEMPRLAGASPEVLIGPIALATRRMRVGSGGVMLPHYSPRKVAETFSVLAGLFGDRIDLGVGRAAGSDHPATIHALQRDRRTPSPDDFFDQLDELLAYLDGRPGPDRRFAELPPLPGHPHSPQPWLLGSTAESAIRAAALGIPYAFGDFINPGETEPAALYRRFFKPSRGLRAPRLALCVSAICADSDEEALRLAASGRMAAFERRAGRPGVLPPVTEAVDYVAGRDAELDARMRNAIVGSPQVVRAALEERARRYGADELLVLTLTHGHGARVRSYELIAQAFGLPR